MIMIKFDNKAVLKSVLDYDRKDKRYAKIFWSIFLPLLLPLIYSIIMVFVRHEEGTEEILSVLVIMAIFLPVAIAGFVAMVINEKWIDKIEHIDFLHGLIDRNFYHKFVKLSTNLNITYLGYDTLEEDIVIVYYKFDDTEDLIEKEYHFYDSFSDSSDKVTWERKFECLKDEDFMHCKHLAKIYGQETKNAEAKKEARFQEKIKSLWK